MTENVTYGLNERTEVVRPLSTLLGISWFFMELIGTRIILKSYKCIMPYE